METHHFKPIDEEKEELSVENNEPGELGYNYGDDEIEIDKGEGEKIVYGASFSPKDGDLGDESEDHGDLPSSVKENGHAYDPTLSSGQVDTTTDQDELKQGIRVVDAGQIGMAFGPDNYVDDAEDEK